MASSSHGPPSASSTGWQTLAGVSALMLVFVASGWPLMKKLGIEVDEALLANGIYPSLTPEYSWRGFGNEVPVMLMTYLGALKTWMYSIIFSVVTPTPVSLRLPMLIVGAITVALFFLWLDRVAGRHAAWIGAALLSTDPSFVVTESIDLGFVALQQALKLGALVLLVEFHRRPSVVRLGGAFFLLGLALWDKAVFVWILVSLVITGVLVFWREVRSYANPRNFLIAAAAFVFGALPFIIYNVERPLETIRQNAHVMADNPQIKLIVSKRSLDGSGLFGFVTAPDEGPHPGQSRGLSQHLAFAVSRIFGAPTTTFTMWAFALSLLAIPLVWRTPLWRPVIFSVTMFALTWLEMFFTAGAGGAVHHLILLWPFHIAVIAMILSALSDRVPRLGRHVALAMAGVLCVSNILVVNQYYVAVVRNGTGVRWTDAFTPLEAYLYQAKMGQVNVSDWGITETLNLMSEGELKTRDASFALRTFDDSKSRELVTQLLNTKNSLWVAHSTSAEQWTGTKARLLEFATSLGYSQDLLQIVHDRNGRPIFDIFRFRAAH